MARLKLHGDPLSVFDAERVVLRESENSPEELGIDRGAMTKGRAEILLDLRHVEFRQVRLESMRDDVRIDLSEALCKGEHLCLADGAWEVPLPRDVRRINSVVIDERELTWSGSREIAREVGACAGPDDRNVLVGYRSGVEDALQAIQVHRSPVGGRNAGPQSASRGRHPMGNVR